MLLPLQDGVLYSDTNKEQLALKKLTQRLITSIDDLISFGLYLGFTCNMIEQRITNNPRSVEGAAFTLACDWWSFSIKSIEEKKPELLKCCEVVNKLNLKSEIKELLEIETSHVEQEENEHLSVVEYSRVDNEMVAKKPV